MDAPSHPEGYRLLGLLSSGGMGEVYLARREGPAGFSKLVVVKRILRHLSRDASAVELFVREARVAALLSHPNLVQIFELGQHGEDYFIAMEYIRGRTVRAVLERLQARGQQVPPAVAAALATQALRGLHYAHTFCDEQGTPLGVVHRDVSPENLLVAFDGHVKLVDFGIAQAQLDAAGQGPDGVRGKRAYMAPEQQRAGAVDGRADLYALGAVLHELLTGSPPAPHGAPDGLEAAGVPALLAGVVRTALSQEPAQRFPSARAMLSAVEAARPVDTPLPQELLAAFMAEVFGADAAHAEAVPERPLSTPPLLITVPLAGGTRMLTVPLEAAGPAPAAAESGVASAGTELPASSARGGRRARLGFRAALLVLGGGAAAVALLGPAVHRSERREAPAPALAGAAPALTDVASARAALPGGATPAPLLVPGDAAAADAAANAASAGAAASERPRGETPAPSARSVESPGREPIRLGRLSIRANPWAEAFVDGKPLGQTPLSDVPLLAGRHRLVLRNPELGAERRRVVNVPAGGHAVVKEDLLIPVSR
ncbi:MAG: protein kinase [Myxococcaceae bacterium]|nr:protein kinase [Myxococcaceae bacterium]MCI0669718.1 protein kinase [Myxococcaceae bacterium]